MKMLLWLRTAAAAISDCLSQFSWPGNKLLEEIIAISHEPKACFKRLEDNPKAATKECYWPPDKE